MKTDIDFFLAIHNIRSRGFDRLRNLLKSLYYQTYKVNRVWVCDGSSRNDDSQEIRKICDGFPSFAEYCHHPMEKMNKPKLLNTAAAISTAEILVFSDVDYIFSPNLVMHAVEKMELDTLTMLYKGVRLLPAGAKPVIETWTVGSSRSNPFPPHIACGAFMCHTRNFFTISGGMDERMEGMSGMDEDYLRRARLAGKVDILDEGVIYHQWHRPVKRPQPSPDQQRNWILRDLNNQKKVVNWRTTEFIPE